MRLEEGYIVVLLHPDDPLFGMTGSRKGRGVLEHRLVMARHLGRPLIDGEFVHHRNGNRVDNRIENLELWTTHHPKGQRVKDLYAWASDFVKSYEREFG